MSIADAFQRLRVAADDGRLGALCRAHGVELLTVFGSVLRDPVAARDLDVAVSTAPGAAVLELVAGLTALTDTDGIDLLVLDGASPTARRNGLVGAVPLVEARPGLFARTQMAAALEFYETAWMRRLDLERMAAS